MYRRLLGLLHALTDSVVLAVRRNVVCDELLTAQLKILFRALALWLGIAYSHDFELLDGRVNFLLSSNELLLASWLGLALEARAAHFNVFRAFLSLATLPFAL